MAEIDDVMRSALRQAVVADLDVAAARQAVRGRIAAGETGPRLETAPGWRLAFLSAYRVAWTAFAVVVAVVVAVLVIAGLRDAAPVPPGEPGTGMTTLAPVSGSGSGSAALTGSFPITGPLSAGALVQTPPASTTTRTTATTPTTAGPTPSAPAVTPGIAPPPMTSSAPAGGTTTVVTPRATATSQARTTGPVSTRTTGGPPSSTPPPGTAPSSTTRGTTTVTTTTSGPAPDTEPPVILSLFATAQEVTPGQTVSIVAQATDNVGVTGIRLAWSGEEDGLPAGTAEMTPSQTGWVFTVTVPKLDRGGTVVFTATARDAAGNRSEQAAVAVMVAG